MINYNHLLPHGIAEFNKTQEVLRIARLLKQQYRWEYFTNIKTVTRRRKIGNR